MQIEDKRSDKRRAMAYEIRMKEEGKYDIEEEIVLTRNKIYTYASPVCIVYCSGGNLN